MPVLNVVPTVAGIIPNVVGVNPQSQGFPTVIYIQTNDTAATVVVAGYLNKSKKVYGSVYNNDQMALVYTTDRGPIWLQVSISGSNTSLAYPNEAAAGVSYTGTLTAGHLTKVNNASGIIEDAGIVASAVATYSGATVVGNLVKASSIAGQIADQGVAFKSVAGAAAAGGAAAQSFTDAFCTSGSCVVGNWNTQANAASVLTIVPGNGSFVVTSSADAGVGTFNYLITK